MRYRSYNAEIKTAVAQILDVFNDIIIDRRNKAGVQKLIHVPCVYGNRSRELKSLENPDKTLKIPLIVLSKNSLSRDTTRVSDINNGMMFQAGSYHKFAKDKPTPMNIEFEITIVTKFEEDMDQIISNFIPMIRPDFYVVWPNPKEMGKYLKSQVVWDGSINYEYPMDASETDPYRIIATSTFTYKTWLFPGLANDNNNGEDGPLIHRINFCPNLLSTEDGNYGLDRWYDVPYSMTLDQYQNNIVCGLIKVDQTRDNWDFLPMSGGISGYWSDISALVTGDVLGQSISSNPVFCADDQGNILLMNDLGYLPAGMENVDVYGLYLSCLSGDLSGCCNL